MIDSINIMVPTYKRPEKMGTLINSVYATAKNHDTIYWTILKHAGDDSKYDFDKISCFKRCFLIESDKSPDLSLFYNRMYTETAFKGDNTVVTMIGDDMEFKTPGWDERIIAALNECDGYGIVHCNDGGIQNGAIPVNIFTTRAYVDLASDTFMVPGFPADWIDTAWGEVSMNTGTNFYLPDVLIQHNHATKCGIDETYSRLRSVVKENRSAYWEWIAKSITRLKEAGIYNE